MQKHTRRNVLSLIAASAVALVFPFSRTKASTAIKHVKKFTWKFAFDGMEPTIVEIDQRPTLKIPDVSNPNISFWNPITIKIVANNQPLFNASRMIGNAKLWLLDSNGSVLEVFELKDIQSIGVTQHENYSSGEVPHFTEISISFKNVVYVPKNQLTNA